MIQCKRFRWEDEFNEWAKTANISGDQVVVILHAKDDSMMIFYDKSCKKNYCSDRPNDNWYNHPYITCDDKLNISTTTTSSIKH